MKEAWWSVKNESVARVSTESVHDMIVRWGLYQIYKFKYLKQFF